MYRSKPSAPQHEFSSTQVEITGRPAQTMLGMVNEIPARELVADEGDGGRETDPHVTVKYGLHFQTPSQRLREALRQFGPVTLTFGRTSLFKSKDADVLKVDIDSPDLHRLNKLITRLLPTHETYPTYIPHATLAYLKPGKGKHYVGSRALAGTKVKMDSVLFSGKNGHKEMLPLGEVQASYRVR